MAKYRIVRRSKLGIRGQEEDVAFFVEKKYNVLFFSWWKVIRHKVYGYYSASNQPTSFKDVYSANAFINKIKEAGIPNSKWSTTVIKTIN